MTEEIVLQAVPHTSVKALQKTTAVSVYDVTSGDDAPQTELSQLTHCVASMTQMLESLQQPLLTYLDSFASEYVESYDISTVNQMLATSPLASFLADDTITDIFVNGVNDICINRKDVLIKTDAVFKDANNLRILAKAIASSVGRSLDPKRPLVDARLKDGSRVNIIAPPMAVDGINISIRKFPKHEITLDKLIEIGEMSPMMAEFLKLCAKHRVSLLISGGTGSGKTTLLNAISHFIPETERIITIEDTAELRLQQPHVVRLETKEPQFIGERSEEVNTSDLVRNALRMRPHRIIIGEVRAEEAYDMIQALNTGHSGSMTTVHANNPRDALTRLENLVGLRMPNTAAASIRQQIVSVLNIIVQLKYNNDGKRMVSSITEIVGMEGDIPTVQEIFTLRETKDEEGNPKFTQHWTKIIPRNSHIAEAMRNHDSFRNELTGAEA